MLLNVFAVEHPELELISSHCVVNMDVVHVYLQLVNSGDNIIVFWDYASEIVLVKEGRIVDWSVTDILKRIG